MGACQKHVKKGYGRLVNIWYFIVIVNRTVYRFKHRTKIFKIERGHKTITTYFISINCKFILKWNFINLLDQPIALITNKC